jgi:toxin CcdB
MAQWDVYPNPSAASRSEVPYLVDAQSDLLQGVPTRFVVPLAQPKRRLVGLPQRMSPVFEIDGQSVLLVPQEAGSVPARLLRAPVASLREDAHRIVDALDAVVSGV